MLKYQTTLGSRLKQIFGVLSPILVDGNVIFDAQGLSVYGITETMEVRLTLPKSGTESYEYTGTDCVVGLDFKSLAAWLKAVLPGEIISFEGDIEQIATAEKPTITYKHWSSSMNHEVRMNVMRIDQRVHAGSTARYDTVLSLKSQQLDEFIKRHAQGGSLIRLQSVVVGPEAVLEPEDAFLIMHSYGQNPAETTVPCKMVPSTSRVKNLAKACAKEQKYVLKTLKAITKAYTVAETAHIRLKLSDKLCVSYKLEHGGTLDFYVDPYVEDAEEDEEEAAEGDKVKEVEVTVVDELAADEDEDATDEETEEFKAGKRSSPPKPILKKEVKKVVKFNSLGSAAVSSPPKKTAKMRQAASAGPEPKTKKVKVESPTEQPGYTLEQFKQDIKRKASTSSPSPDPIKIQKVPVVQASQRCTECNKPLLGSQSITSDEEGNLVHKNCIGK